MTPILDCLQALQSAQGFEGSNEIMKRFSKHLEDPLPIDQSDQHHLGKTWV
jgi:hypothetical protein